VGVCWCVVCEIVRNGDRGSTPNEGAWEEKLARLAAYKAAHGDCNVPQGWAEDPKLARWVGTQRRCKKALDHGDPSER
jgi:hypothetical protein